MNNTARNLTRECAIDMQEMAAHEYAYARRAFDEAGESANLRAHVKLDQEQAARIAAKTRAVQDLVV